MIVSLDAQLEGIARLLDAATVLVATWTAGGMARVEASSSHGLVGLTLPIPESFLANGESHVIASPAPAHWITAPVRAAAMRAAPSFDADAGLAVCICGVSAALDGGERAAMVAVWPPRRDVPGIVDGNADALNAVIAGIVRGALVAKAEATTRSRLEALVEAVPEGIVLTDDETGTARVNAAAAQLLGIPAGIVTAAELSAALRTLHERSADPAGLAREGAALFQRPDVVVRDWVWEVVAPERRILRVATLPVRGATHHGRLWTFEDITELDTQRKALQQALAHIEQERDRLWEAEERYRLATRATRDVIWDWEIGSDRILWSDTLRTTLGYDGAEIASMRGWRNHIHPDDRERVVSSLDATLRARQESWSADYRFLRADGSYASVRDRGTLVCNADGTPIRMIGALQDESARVVLEAQLRQVQKMEGIGRLAGGVAHDFNNLLTVIRGSLEFVRMSVPPSGSAADDLAEAQKAVERATALTRQLLAFSRRQVLQLRPVDLHEVIHGVEKLLRRVIGEDVGLRTRLEAAHCTVRADPGQIEQVLVNLAVNARDAMPDGGELVVRTLSSLPEEVDGDAVPLGAAPILGAPHVLLAISDTGTGMDASVVASAFEPFFTTKDVSKGSGLGLSIVHGIVTQSGGAVWLESARGAGTTAWIALPIVHDEVRGDGVDVAVPAARRASTVLVVEDEASVRALTARILRSAGYRVLTATNGRDALTRWTDKDGLERGVDVVVSDVVMPDMGGREFVRRVRALHPEIPVLFVSGYTDGELAASTVGGRAAFLEKPFSSAALLSKLALLLGDGAH